MNPKVKELLSKDYEFRIGHHSMRMPGYYALFFRPNYVPDCPHCDRPVAPEMWMQYGHGFTEEQAIENAYAIAMDQPFTYLSSLDFIAQN